MSQGNDRSGSRETRHRRTSATFQKNPFGVLLVASVIGILFDRMLPVPISSLAVIACVLTFAAWIAILTSRIRIGFATLFVGTIALLGCWHQLHWRHFPAAEISRILPRGVERSHPVLVEAIVVEQPTTLSPGEPNPMATIPGGDRTMTRIRFQRLRVADKWQEVSGLADMFVDGHLVGVRAGSRLQVVGELMKPKRAKNPGERNRRNERRAERVLSQLRVGHPDCVSVLPRQSVGLTEKAFEALHAIRSRCHAAIDGHIPNEHSELAKALLLGARDGVSPQTIDAFFLTGTMHLLAISGLHVGILAFAFFFVARRGVIPFRWPLMVAMVFIIGYAILTGARPPVIRAAILIQIMCISWISKRRAYPVNSLALAAIVVLLLNPCDLFRVGAQLSFIAVASLAWFSSTFANDPPVDPLDRLIWRTRPWPKRLTDFIRRSLQMMLMASCVVWIACLPLAMYQFHVASPISILLNVILTIPVAIALTAGVVTISVASIFPHAAEISGAICGASLGTMHRIVTIIEPLPGSHFWTPGHHLGWTLVFYVALALYGMKLVRLRIRGLAMLVLAWFVLPIFASNAWRAIETPPLKATLISVGHGTSVLLKSPNGRTVLYDCGHMGIPDSAIDTISGVLWSDGLRTLDAIVISHADADHYNALPELLARFQVGCIIIGPDMFEDESDAVAHLEKEIASAGVPVLTVHKGQQLNLCPSIRCEIIHPSRQTEFSSDNAASIVMRITCANRTILLPGDLEKDGLEHLLLQKNDDLDVIMAPHHGSKNSVPNRFRDWSNPGVTVISAGQQTSDEMLPAIEAFESAGRVFHTELDGAVTVEVDVTTGRLTVESYLGTETTVERIKDAAK